MKKNKILILTPPLGVLGGVSLHYKGLQKYWKENVRYFEAYRNTNPTVLSVLLLFLSINRFVFEVITYRPNLLVINISLKKGFFSKNIHIWIAKYLFGLKVITFIHGWDRDSEFLLNTKKASLILNKSDAIIVLANEFRNKIIISGAKAPVYLSTTKVDEELLKDYKNSERNGIVKKLLFVSRIEKEKGIFIALNTFKKLLEDIPDLSLNIVGDGEALSEVRLFVEKERIPNINIAGRLSGEKLACAFRSADFFILPTYYGEGMPAALLEAIAFGLPVAVRPAGGIADFFVDGEMGILVDSFEPQIFYEKIKKLIDDTEKTKHISQVNYDYARKHFRASAVAGQLESIFNKILSP